MSFYSIINITKIIVITETEAESIFLYFYGIIQDMSIIYANFQIDILNHALEIHKKLNRQDSVCHPV